jgi:hypothetical protein
MTSKKVLEKGPFLKVELEGVEPSSIQVVTKISLVFYCKKV